jgi:hypothetical protein
MPRADSGCLRAVPHGVGSGVARRWLGQERHGDQTADLSVRPKSEVRRFGAKNARPSLRGALPASDMRGLISGRRQYGGSSIPISSPLRKNRYNN